MVVDVDTDGKGRTFYAVERIGTFTVGLVRHEVDNGRVQVDYGRVTTWTSGYRLADEHPVVHRVPLIGSAVFSPERMTAPDVARDGYWLACRRPTGDYTAESVSAATRAATADIVRALVEHWQADPETALRIAETGHVEGPRRILEAFDVVEGLDSEIDALRQRRAEAQAEVERRQEAYRLASATVEEAAARA